MKIIRFIVIVVLAFSSTSCTQHLTKRHIKNETVKLTGKKFLFLNPDVYIYEIGVAQLTPIEDRTNKSRFVMREAFRDLSNELNFEIVHPNDTNEVKSIRGILNATSRTVSDYEYPTKKANFDYEIGDIQELLDNYDSDYLIYAYGFDFEQSAGRVATDLAVSVLAAFAGMQVTHRYPQSKMTLCIVNKQGQVQRFIITTADDLSFDSKYSISKDIKGALKNARL